MNETLSLFGIVLCLLGAILAFCLFKFETPKRKVALITFKKKNVKFYGLCGLDYEYLTVDEFNSECEAVGIEELIQDLITESTDLING